MNLTSLDYQNDGVFEWVDGHPMTYSNWGPNEPVNRNYRQDCGRVATGKTQNRWS